MARQNFTFSFNKTILGGFLGEEPRRIADGKGVAIRLCTNRRWLKDGEWHESTVWHSLTCWERHLVEGIASLHKGNFAIFEGEIEYRSYVDKKDGAKKFITEIRILGFNRMSAPDVSDIPPDDKGDDPAAETPKKEAPPPGADDDSLPF